MPSKRKNTDESPWGYAVAGCVALAFAALIQFALAELPHNVLKYLPIGKLAMTVPLAALGIALIARDFVANFGKPPAVVVRTSRERARPAPQPRAADPTPDSDVVPTEELALESVPEEEPDLEIGEPLAEDLGPKIPALRGRFSWLLGDDSYKPRARREEA
jgi:hypothetical protein